MPTKGKKSAGSRRGSQVLGNNVKPGTAAPSALKGADTNSWDVTGEASRMAEAQMDRSEPFVQAPLKGAPVAFPTIYGVDLKEKRRQTLLEQGAAGGLGNRLVMLDDKTIDWIMKEQDRIYMIERDMIFEASAKEQGLFNNPAGLEYLHKINPGYFSRRRKMAKWLVKTQLKLFDVAMDGVQNESDFDFMLMIQSLPAQQMNLLNTPAHKLMEVQPGDAGLYQRGVFRKNRLPETGAGPVGAQNRQVPFAGVTSQNWAGLGQAGLAALGANGQEAVVNGGLNFANYGGVGYGQGAGAPQVLNYANAVTAAGYVPPRNFLQQLIQ